jgi:hypothetical protein
VGCDGSDVRFVPKADIHHRDWDTDETLRSSEAKQLHNVSSSCDTAIHGCKIPALD